jgi:hypothetical protein
MRQVSTQEAAAAMRVPQARYAYYRRCQVFRRNGEQCKAPAEKGSQICYAHAGQLVTAVRRERERRAVLAEAVAEMRRQGKAECEMADLFTDFKGIQVTLAVMARALINGRIDCKTAGQMVVHLQTCSKLLWQIHRKGRKDLPLINTDDTDLKKIPKPNPLPRIDADDADRQKLKLEKDWGATSSATHAPDFPGAQILQFDAMAFGDGSRAHSPPEWKAA